MSFHQIPTLLLVLIFITSCNGQVKTTLTNDSGSEQKSNFFGPKLTKTQGSSLGDNIYCSLQDKAGNLWFGATGEGVYRYDGTSFTQFTVKDGLNSNNVWSILEDKTGSIWIGTNAGVCRYDGKTMTKIPIVVTNGSGFNPNNPPNNSPSEKNEVFSILQDKSGIIWFGTTDGVYCYDGVSFTRFLDNNNIINEGRLSLKYVQCMLEDKNGNIWFGSGPMAFEGICLYDGISLTKLKLKDETWIRNMMEDKDGHIWVGTRRYGGCRYDGKTFTFFTEKEGIGNPIFIDKSGNMWFSGEEDENGYEASGGVWRYDGHSFQNFTTKDGLGNYYVWSIVEDTAGNLWFGTRNTGLYMFDGKGFSSFSE